MYQIAIFIVKKNIIQLHVSNLSSTYKASFSLKKNIFVPLDNLPFNTCAEEMVGSLTALTSRLPCPPTCWPSSSVTLTTKKI